MNGKNLILNVLYSNTMMDAKQNQNTLNSYLMNEVRWK